MSFSSIIVMSILSVCGASQIPSSTGSSSANPPSSQSLVVPISSPEASVHGSRQLAQLNMESIDNIMAQAMKDTITRQREPTFNSLPGGTFPTMNRNPTISTANAQTNPLTAVPRSSMPAMPSMPAMASMPAMTSMPFNPMRMLMSGGSSPFSIMNARMMMKMMENIMEMFSF